MSRPHASSVDAQDPWGAGDIASPLSSTRTAEAQDDDDELDPAEIQEKERLVKDFTTKQDGLKALMERISSVNKETQEIKSGNETLQTYIDNLTRNNAQAAVSGGGKR
ncbi:BZ3500_MvSof-1268-A1-R1_Chr3-3g06533 [Microbotryum saponariae]|uniref:BZ3500_MvSof-1268-A1-R1_Chr3-3g06533 protein n=1 Tax=Microbotryum saponariae TaxID=289078 RepID=A0A2X0LH60_9BASI|nr:BZ3500_MvSof-1268-A1-R1_Chr3-3g06533 [Microbotryum saponariae]SDA04500.1 BZ3501_MvSof-1269-A2-R1_Chr3-2g06220 [Microbotryum saponariae]